MAISVNMTSYELKTEFSFIGLPETDDELMNLLDKCKRDPVIGKF